MIKKTTDQKIDELAAMTARGFEDISSKMATKTDLAEAEKRLTERLDRIEFFVTGHERRIDVLEDRVRQLAVRVGFRFK